MASLLLEIPQHFTEIDARALVRDERVGEMEVVEPLLARGRHFAEHEAGANATNAVRSPPRRRAFSLRRDVEHRTSELLDRRKDLVFGETRIPRVALRRRHLERMNERDLARGQREGAIGNVRERDPRAASP